MATLRQHLTWEFKQTESDQCKEAQVGALPVATHRSRQTWDENVNMYWPDRTGPVSNFVLVSFAQPFSFFCRVMPGVCGEQCGRLAVVIGLFQVFQLEVRRKIDSCPCSLQKTGHLYAYLNRASTENASIASQSLIAKKSIKKSHIISVVCRPEYGYMVYKPQEVGRLFIVPNCSLWWPHRLQVTCCQLHHTAFPTSPQIVDIEFNDSLLISSRTCFLPSGPWRQTWRAWLQRMGDAEGSESCTKCKPAVWTSFDYDVD